jgi:hypothetical protein
VVPTVTKEKSPFLGAQNTRPTAVEMAQAPVAEDDGIPWRDRLRAFRARGSLPLRHWSIPMQRDRMGLTPGGHDASLRLPECSSGGRREDSTLSPPCSNARKIFVVRSAPGLLFFSGFRLAIIAYPPILKDVNYTLPSIGLPG